MSEIRMLDELRAELARVAAKPRRRRWPAIFAVALVAGVAAAPATRAGVEDMVGWITRDAGTPVGDDAPEWLRSDVRLIAESRGAKLYVARHDDYVDVAVGDGFGTGASVEDWSKRFAEHKLLPLGPATVGDETWDARGRFALMGLTARSVARVEATFASGPPVSASGLRGGFVLWVPARRPLRELIAYDADGRELERASVRHIDLSRVCRDARGCPPGRWTLAPEDPGA